ncbi:MAG: HupE/UreJ family protein [Xanthomonadales bacterium]|jgi:hydrogenase/urease accessory protein HupE|nr:HupE/UreJ family protein [Xanthomonadales bacterium]
MSLRTAGLAALLLTLFLLAGLAQAHEVRPGYLRIQQQDTEHVELLWRVPARGNLRLSLDVVLPEHCVPLEPVSRRLQNALYVDQWRVSCPGGLTGHEVLIDGLSSLMTDVLVRYERLDGTTQVVRLTPASPGFTVSDSESWGQVAATYTVLGMEHILLGIDHLLFVLALLLIISGWRKLVATITAFTVAHSITLAASTLGWVNMPGPPVEAVIALSILFVAVEIVHWRQGRPGITRQRPWLVAFAFGLLHGFGFAGALSDIGLPEHAIPLALLFFNLGVELGQLVFVAAMLVTSALLRRISWPDWAWRVPVYGIGAMAGFWTIERLAGF